MKAALLALSVMAAASSAAAEQPRQVQSWLEETREAITQSASADPRAVAPVRVQFRLGVDQRVTGVHAVRSSGSHVVDQAVVDAVRKTRLTRAPAELIGREITVTVNPAGPVLQAATPSNPVR